LPDQYDNKIGQPADGYPLVSSSQPSGALRFIIAKIPPGSNKKPIKNCIFIHDVRISFACQKGRIAVQY
jgi:hypothetical protein